MSRPPSAPFNHLVGGVTATGTQLLLPGKVGDHLRGKPAKNKLEAFPQQKHRNVNKNNLRVKCSQLKGNTAKAFENNFREEDYSWDAGTSQDDVDMEDVDECPSTISGRFS